MESELPPWRYSAIIKNLPPSYILGHLTAYLADAGIDCELQECDNDSRTALVRFSRKLTGLIARENQEKLNVSSPFQGQKLEFAKIEEAPRSIIVRDVVTTVSQDHLLLYFEWCCGCTSDDGQVERCEMLRELHLAVVTFCDSSVASNVLVKSEHRLGEKTYVYIEPFYDAFHGPLLKALAKGQEQKAEDDDETTEKDKEESLPPDNPSEEEEDEKGDGEKGDNIDDDAREIENEVDSENDNQTEKRAKEQQGKTLRLSVPIASHRLDLLNDFVEKLPSVCECDAVRADDGVHIIGTTAEQRNTAKQALLAMNQELKEDKLLGVPEPVLAIMRSDKWRAEYAKFREKFPDCTAAIIGTEVVLTAKDKQVLRQAKIELERNIRQKTCKVPVSMLSTPEFELFVKNQEKDHLVHVTLPGGDSNEVLLDGYGEGVDSAAKSLEDFSKTRQRKSKTFTLSRMCDLALKTWFAGEWGSIKAFISEHKGTLNKKTTAGGAICLTVVGGVSFVEDVDEKLKGLLGKIKETVIDLYSLFPSPTDCEMVITGLRQYHPDRFCEKLSLALQEEGIACVINIFLPPRISEVTQGKEDPVSTVQTTDHTSSPSTPATYDGLRGSAQPHLCVLPVHSRTRSMPTLQSAGRSFTEYSTTYEDVKITIQCGDINETKADIIVNVVGSDLYMKKTGVGRAILAKSPATQALLREEARREGIQSFHVLKTKLSRRFSLRRNRTDELQASLIFHAVLRPCSNEAILFEKLNSLVRHCLAKAAKAGWIWWRKTIAFPPLGVGTTFGFPEDVVVLSMVYSTVVYLRETWLAQKEIKFVMRDEDLCRKFQDKLESELTYERIGLSKYRRLFLQLRWKQPHQSTESPRTFADISGGRRSVLEDTSNAVWTLNPDAQSKDRRKALDAESNRQGPSSAQSRQVAEFKAVICTKADSDFSSSVSDRLKQELTSVCLFEGRLSPAFDRLDPQTQGNVRQEACDRSVQVCGEAGHFTARGVEDSVTKVVQLVLEWSVQPPDEQDQERLLMGLPTNTHRLPDYWNVCKKDRGCTFGSAVRNWREGIYSHSLEDVSSAESDAVKHMVESAWNSERTVGQGSDAKNLHHTGIKVTKVRRLENPELFEKYSEQREKLFRRILLETDSGQAGPFLPVKDLPNSTGNVLTTFFAEDLLTRQIYQEVNEHYLLHGTKQAFIKAIIDEGFDFRLSNNGLHGRGTYFAEATNKSDQYTDPKTNRTSKGTDLNVIVARVLLGQPYVNTTKVSKRFTRPPCTRCNDDKCQCRGARRFDSVMDNYAGRQWREFIVYDLNDCYPEYFVTYRRVYAK